MNAFIETLNQWGGNFLSFAWPMLWQSSLVIAALLAFDFLFRRKLRASIRYALWLVVLVKLCVPPTLALPTSPAWWLHKTPPPIAAKALPHYTVTYDNGPFPEIPQTPLPAFVPPRPTMTNAAWLLVASAAVSVALLCWLLVRWWQITRLVCRAATVEQFSELLGEALRLAVAPVSDPAYSSSFLKRAGSETGVPSAWQASVRLKLVEGRMSPAVCGLLHPVILLPRSLTERLSAGQLRAVLLHELIHLRRRDVWVNFLQALLQIVYWWHPLVWLANAHIRRVREEAVDDAVMLALRDDAESYAPTLLEVAKLALNRPLASLGLVGILESRHSLRQRIERLVDFRPPRRAGLTLVSVLGILAFTAVAVPMGEGPSLAKTQTAPGAMVPSPTSIEQKTNLPSILIQGFIYQMRTVDFDKIVSDLKFNPAEAGRDPWWSASPEKFSQLVESLKSSGIQPITRPRIQTSSGMPASMYVGDGTNGLEFDCTPIIAGSRVDLMIQGKLVDARGNEAATNQFNAKTSVDNHGGIVIRTKNIGGAGESNVVVITGVQLITNLVAGHGPSAHLAEKNSVAMTFKLNHPIREDELKDKLLAAGVEIPTTAFFYTDSGMFLVRGSGEQLALVNRLILKLNGYSPKEIEAGDKQFLKEINETGFEGASNTNLYSRHFRVGTNEFVTALQNSHGPSSGDISTMAKNLFGTLGVNWESPKGKSVFYNARLGELFVRATTPDLSTIEQALAVLLSASSQNSDTATNVLQGKQTAGQLVQDGKLLYEMGKLDEAEMKLKAALALDTNNVVAKYYLELVQTNQPTPKIIKISEGRQEIVRKLQAIRLDRVAFEAVPLNEVVRTLSGESKKLDPEHRGFNFIINPNSEQTATPTIDPTTGLPLATGAGSDFDLISIPITINPPLTNISLGDVLNALVKAAPEPIYYSVQDYAIVFRAGKPLPQLYNRHFRVDASNFMAALRNAYGIKSNSVSAMARECFRALGVNLDVPGKAIYYSDSRGELFVRASAQDLDTIENALEVTSRIAPQIHIKARFLEVPKGILDGLKNIASITNQFAASNQVAGLVGILTDKNFRALLHNLETRPGVETLAEPEVVTTSGRQTQVRAAGVDTILTNFMFEEYPTKQNGIVGSITAKTGPIETGPIFDMVPYVLSDGYTLDLQMTASSMEFYGYAEIPTNLPPLTTTTSTGETVVLSRTWPAVLRYQKSAHVNFFDGQTVILSIANSEQVRFGEPDDKREAVVAKHIRDTAWHNGGRNDILVFVTATLVDRVGNRFHSDDELKFAHDGIPPQPQPTK